MRDVPIDRRDFLQTTSQLTLALVAAAGVGSPHAARAADAMPRASEFIPGKDDGLIVYNAKVGEIETPLAALRQHRLTPKELLFVRNNQVLPGSLTLKPHSLADWVVEIAGLVDSPRKLRGEDLAKFEQVDVELVLQCSGNGRSKFAKALKADGVQWQNGAMGNVRFRGVRLKTVLDELGVRLKTDAKFVAGEGNDAPEKKDAPDFEHSLPLADALDRSLLVLSMNGEPLPAAHGGPVRLVTPGFYATMNVKWLSRLRFEANESDNYHHMPRYRTPKRAIEVGSKYTYSHDNSDPNWDMKIKSTIFAPLDGEIVSGGPVEIHGVAWNDGQARIESVEVSIDAGRSWRRAELERPSSPFAWHHWTLKVSLPPGPATIQSRAADALGRTQPLDGTVFWNAPGYAWNGVDEVRVTVQ